MLSALFPRADPPFGDDFVVVMAIGVTETLRQANREFKTEGEETLVFNIRDGKPMITSLEQTFPGDST